MLYFVKLQRFLCGLSNYGSAADSCTCMRDCGMWGRGHVCMGAASWRVWCGFRDKGEDIWCMLYTETLRMFIMGIVRIESVTVLEKSCDRGYYIDATWFVLDVACCLTFDTCSILCIQYAPVFRALIVSILIVQGGSNITGTDCV